MSTNTIRPYEVVIIMHPDANEETQKTLFRKNKEIIEGFKGKVNHVDSWGKRVLANPIGKIKRATYFHSTFTADTQAIAELERTMRINDNVLRFLHTRLDERQDIKTHLESFKAALRDSVAREKERAEKKQARRMRIEEGEDQE